MGALCLVLVLVFSTLCPSSFAEERAGCFTLIVSLMSSDCKRSVALLYGAVGWPAVCQCQIVFSFIAR